MTRSLTRERDNQHYQKISTILQLDQVSNCSIGITTGYNFQVKAKFYLEKEVHISYYQFEIYKPNFIMVAPTEGY